MGSDLARFTVSEKDFMNMMPGTIIIPLPKPPVISIEKIGTYKGLYHVLDGLISPMTGKNPEDLNIKSLLDRIKQHEIKELILVLTPSIEGETTMQYIKKVLENVNVKSFS